MNKKITERRPMLGGMADACDAFAAANPDAVAGVKATADRWRDNR